LKGRGKGGKLGTLLFFVPIVLVLAFVVYAILGTVTFQNGTLVVRAQTTARYYPTQYLNVSVIVSGRSGVTPFSLTLAPGTYGVSFPPQRWYVSPQSKIVNVTGGGTSYVVGVFNPISVPVSVGQGKFNTTSVAVLHKATPLVWINPSSTYEVITSDLTGNIVIPPMQNYTYIFRSTGTFAFSFVGAQSAVLVVTSV
jgi:hypothetical protein